jgi:hypothetical protein
MENSNRVSEDDSESGMNVLAKSNGACKALTVVQFCLKGM